MSNSLNIYPRVNLLGTELQACKILTGAPTTGYYRNNFCDATPSDGASHTVASVVTAEFLDFSASRGNDLRPLLPPGSTWCLCAKRWNEALVASADHPLGEKIVPRVIAASTHEKAGDVIGQGGKESLLRFAQVEQHDGDTCEIKDKLTEKRLV